MAFEPDSLNQNLLKTFLKFLLYEVHTMNALAKERQERSNKRRALEEKKKMLTSSTTHNADSVCEERYGRLEVICEKKATKGLKLFHCHRKSCLTCVNH